MGAYVPRVLASVRGECEARECQDDEERMLHLPQSRRVLRVTGLHTIATHVHAPTSKLTC